MKHSIILVTLIVSTFITSQAFAYVDALCRKTFYQGGQALEAKSIWTPAAKAQFDFGAMTAFTDGTGTGGSFQGWDLIDHPDYDYYIIFYWFGGLPPGPWSLEASTSVFNINGLDYEYSYDSPATCSGNYIIT